MSEQQTMTLTPSGETRIPPSGLPIGAPGLQKIEIYVPQTREPVQIPCKLKLGTLSDWRLRVIVPIAVELRREDGSVVAFAPEFDEFGYGANSSEAVVDLQQTITELYFSLVES